jgi:hypothetical protein
VPELHEARVQGIEKVHDEEEGGRNMKEGLFYRSGGGDESRYASGYKFLLHLAYDVPEQEMEACGDCGFGDESEATT